MFLKPDFDDQRRPRKAAFRARGGSGWDERLQEVGAPSPRRRSEEADPGTRVAESSQGPRFSSRRRASRSWGPRAVTKGSGPAEGEGTCRDSSYDLALQIAP